jgi:hypothetical protein
MTIDELRLAFQDKTTIQKQELSSKLIGMDITLECSIINIEPNEIKFEFISNFDNMEGIGNHYHVGYICLQYDKEKFRQELLSYKDGDDAKIIATLTGFTASDIFFLELVSIFRYNSTRKDRVNERYKKFNKSCFIATACYGNYDAPEVLKLRHYRDNVLIKTYFGRVAVSIYYHTSPPIAKFIDKSGFLKLIVRRYLLTPIVSKISQNQ